MPSRKERVQLASQLGMKENQVYKWFWEVKHKQEEEDDMENFCQQFSELKEDQRFEVFINKSLKQYKDKMQLRGSQGKRTLTEEEMIASIKLHSQSIKKEEDFEEMARLVGFDTEKAAKQVT